MGRRTVVVFSSDQVVAIFGNCSFKSATQGLPLSPLGDSSFEKLKGSSYPRVAQLFPKVQDGRIYWYRRAEHSLYLASNTTALQDKKNSQEAEK